MSRTDGHTFSRRDEGPRWHAELIRARNARQGTTVAEELAEMANTLVGRSEDWDIEDVELRPWLKAFGIDASHYEVPVERVGSPVERVGRRRSPTITFAQLQAEVNDDLDDDFVTQTLGYDVAELMAEIPGYGPVSTARAFDMYGYAHVVRGFGW